MASLMPIGNRIGDPIQADQIKLTTGNIAPPEWEDDAAATLVWRDYQNSKSFLENNSWLLEWTHTDIIYQSPTLDRYPRAEQGRPPRVSRFLVAKNTRTMATQVKRALFAEKNPFVLRPTGDTSQWSVDAWTALISKLLERMKFKYNVSLLIDCQVLQGTGMGKLGIEQREVKTVRRKRKTPVTQVPMPITGTAEVPSVESDNFEPVTDIETETWPIFEYRRLGTTLPDPKWCTPNDISSAKYTIDVDYVDCYDLMEMRELDAYKDIPPDAVLKAWFLYNPDGSAAPGSQVEDSMTDDGSSVTHARGRNMNSSADPLLRPVLILERWDAETVKTIIEYDGRFLLIRNEEHNLGCDPHVAANWWSIDNNGYGMGIGRLTGADQRINQGITNECLKMIAYPMNAPILLDRGLNAPTQNVLARMGGFWALDLPPGGDINKAVGFMEMPQISPDAWKMLALSQESGEDISGANAPFMQGNLGGPGSSAARTATGANRVASKADDSVADPVDAVAEGVIVPTILFLIKWVKEKMPIEEIRRILKKSDLKLVLDAIKTEQFLDAELAVDVLAGQRLAAKAGIQQLIPFLLQITQQPQLLQFLHEKGWTVDFFEMLDLFLQMSELQQEPGIFREMTDKEMQAFQQNNPVAAKVAGANALEDAKTKGKIAVVQAQGQSELGNKAAEMAMQHTSDQTLERAEGLVERGQDENILKQGL